MIKWLSEWDNTDLIWCPSQIYREFSFNGETWTLYCRWRHNDPWQISVWKGGTDNPDYASMTMFASGLSHETPIKEVNTFAEEKLVKYLNKKSSTCN